MWRPQPEPDALGTGRSGTESSWRHEARRLAGEGGQDEEASLQTCAAAEAAQRGLPTPRAFHHPGRDTLATDGDDRGPEAGPDGGRGHRGAGGGWSRE